MVRLLIVEDDRAMAIALRDGFESEGYEVTTAHDGARALQLATDDPPDLVVLDLMLPKMSGDDVCVRLRSDGATLPIIMLTARSEEQDKIRGLKLGADDYITKPFSFSELCARVEAVLRRTGPAEPAGGHIAIGDVEVDFARGLVTRGDEPIDLSARELRLLRFFVEHKNEVVDRDALLQAVWDHDDAPLTRTVDVHVSKLRKKLGDDPANPQHLLTVHGLGYKLRLP
ncbi:MAG: response regulator transcription factor [Deltaproteobacteria bacterium]|jgi:DNA-binding response OmpR family regulator